MLFRTECQDLVDIIPALYSQDSEFVSQPGGSCPVTGSLWCSSLPQANIRIVRQIRPFIVCFCHSLILFGVIQSLHAQASSNKYTIVQVRELYHLKLI